MAQRSHGHVALLFAVLCVCAGGAFASRELLADPAPAAASPAAGSSAPTPAQAGRAAAGALAQLLAGLGKLAQQMPKSNATANPQQPRTLKDWLNSNVTSIIAHSEKSANSTGPMQLNMTTTIAQVEPAANASANASAPAAAPAPAGPPPPPSATFMEEFVANKTCNRTMLPNGDFESDEHEAYRITNWVKIKEKGAQGGGIVGNGSDPAATGYPGYPFDNKNQYFKSQAFGNIGFALVNQYAIEVNNSRQILYFDWYMDNAFDYWLVPDTMSIHANASNVTLHAARVDLYDFDKLVPAGNITDLAQYLFDPTNATAGPAYLGPALTVQDIISFGNLQSVGSYVPLAPYVGKRVMVVFRYSTTVYYMAWGIDNVSVVTCDDSLGFYNRRHKLLRRLS